MSQRNPLRIRKQVEVPTEDFEWLLRTHSGASLNWITTLLLHSYRTVCENPTEFIKAEITPSSIALAAAKLTRDQINEGLHQEASED